MHDFLDTEINGLISRDAYLGLAKNYISQKRKGKLELTGNAYSVCIDGDEVSIENIWDESIPGVKISLGEYIKAIENFNII